MKKYLFGLFAIALAISFSAFTTAKKSTDTFYIFDTPSFQASDIGDIETPELWLYAGEVGVDDLTCDQGVLEACQLAVHADDTFVDGVRKLKSTVVIDAIQFQTTLAQVDSYTKAPGTPADGVIHNVEE